MNRSKTDPNITKTRKKVRFMIKAESDPDINNYHPFGVDNNASNSPPMGEEVPEPAVKSTNRGARVALRAALGKIRGWFVRSRDVTAISQSEVEECSCGSTVKKTKKISREWQSLGVPSNSENAIRVGCYNVLCHETMDSSPTLYSHVESSSPFRSWDFRFSILEAELISINADILGLQEISPSAFETSFGPLLEKLGYETVYNAKELERYKHGLILAVRKNRFKVESQECVNYYMVDDSVLDRENLGQIVRLTCKRSKCSILVANSHLVFNPYRGDTKFAQIAFLLAKINSTRRLKEPVICLGDFNLEPGSQLYNYIVNGKLDATSFSNIHGSGQVPVDKGPEEYLFDLPRETFLHTMMDRKGEIQSDLFELLYKLNTTLPNQFTHPLQLTSVYPSEPKPVSANLSENRNPDFIFFNAGHPSSSYLSLNGRLSLPSYEEMEGVCNWPSHATPSDHLYLLAEFSLTKRD